jgi:hypothetical protein
MKRVLMILAGALLVCGLTFAQTDQQTPPAAPELGASTATPLQGSGTITKIDPQSRTITLSDFRTATAPESGSAEAMPEGVEQPAASGETKVFKYNERTNFASTNPESVDGRMSDLKVGDVVSVQFNDTDTIVRIEEVAAAPQPEE